MRRGLVDVVEEDFVNAAVAHVRQVDQQIVAHIALYAKEPAPHLRVGRISRHVLESHVRSVRDAEVCGVYIVGREAVLRVAIGRQAGVNILQRDDAVGRVQGQVAGAGTVPVRIADAEAAAQHRFVVQAEGRADTGPEVLLIRIDRIAVAGGGQRHGLGGDVEVGHLVIGFVDGRGEFVAQAQVHRQPLVHLPVILHVAVQAPIADIGDRGVGEGHPVAITEQEVGIVEHSLRLGGLTSSRGASYREGGADRVVEVVVVAIAAHLRGIHIAAHHRVQVLLRHMEHGVLQAGLDCVAGKQPGVVDLGIPDCGVLVLGAGPQAAKSGEAG